MHESKEALLHVLKLRFRTSRTLVRRYEPSDECKVPRDLRRHLALDSVVLHLTLLKHLGEVTRNVASLFGKGGEEGEGDRRVGLGTVQADAVNRGGEGAKCRKEG